MIEDALAYAKAAELRVQRNLLHLNKRLDQINAARLRSKVETLVERGATEGERAAGTAAMKRLTAAADKAEDATRTLPRTVEEMIARKSKKG